MTDPAHVSALVLGVGVAIIAATLLGLSRALVRADWSAGARLRALRGKLRRASSRDAARNGTAVSA